MALIPDNPGAEITAETTTEPFTITRRDILIFFGATCLSGFPTTILGLEGSDMQQQLLKMDNADITAIAEEAFIFAYPMLENYKTMDRSTGPRIPMERRRQFNSLHHSVQLLGSEFKNIVAPNNDTLYSSGWLDLSVGPQVLSIPDIADKRYYVFQLVNMYNYNFGYMGSRTTGFTAGHYLIANHDWQGEIPQAISQTFVSETRYAFLLGRTCVYGPHDLPAVLQIQQNYRLQSLDQFLGKTTQASVPQSDYPPYNAAAANSAGFIPYLNYLLKNAAIHPDDRQTLNRFSVIGIGADQTFAPDVLPADKIAAIEAGVNLGLERIKVEVQHLGKEINGWRVLGDAHGPRKVMAGRPMVNAAGAMVGLYGNDKEEASNFAGFADMDNKPLNTAKANYRIRFEKGHFPPVKAFWSLTMYHVPEMLMVANPINRYSIGDRTEGIIYGEDGSLEIYIQRESPGAAKESNWLPGPDGPFALAMRNYWPDAERFPKYTPPVIERV